MTKKEQQARSLLTRLALEANPDVPEFVRLAIIGDIARTHIEEVYQALAARGSIYATPYNI